jgi:hypothetical protein
MQKIMTVRPSSPKIILGKEVQTVRNTIDLRDLPEEETKLVQEFVEFLRKKAKAREKKDHKSEKIVFATWPLGVKGKLTRSEIYDYL